MFSKKECLWARGEAGPLCLRAQVPAGKDLQLLWGGRTVRALPAELVFLWAPSGISFPCDVGFAIKASDRMSHFWHQIPLYPCPLEITFCASVCSAERTFCKNLCGFLQIKVRQVPSQVLILEGTFLLLPLSSWAMWQKGRHLFPLCFQEYAYVLYFVSIGAHLQVAEWTLVLKAQGGLRWQSSSAAYQPRTGWCIAGSGVSLVLMITSNCIFI